MSLGIESFPTLFLWKDAFDALATHSSFVNPGDRAGRDLGVGEALQGSGQAWAQASYLGST